MNTVLLFITIIAWIIAVSIPVLYALALFSDLLNIKDPLRGMMWLIVSVVWLIAYHTT